MAQARYPAMDVDCRFILGLIIRIYQDLLQRIEANPQAVLAGDSIQTFADRRALAIQAADESGFQGGVDARADLMPS